MASSTAELRAEFDQLKEISMIPVEGLLLGESLESLYEANQDIAARTVPASRLSTCRPSMRAPCPSGLVQRLANQKPAKADVKCLRFIPDRGRYNDKCDKP